MRYIHFKLIAAIVLLGSSFSLANPNNGDGTANRNWNAWAACQAADGCGGCLAEGTEITLADRNSIAIEQVNAKMMLALPITGSYTQLMSSNFNLKTINSSIVNITNSTAERQMYLLESISGHKLIATDHHPIITANRGAVKMADLLTNDTLITTNGSDKVKSVSKIDYKAARVFNLSVNEAVDLAKENIIGDLKHTFFANGILVGDFLMQLQMFENSSAK